jgi:hypothetical protein
MTIKFVCSCGKRLKARDEMASRRSICPRCGSPVGVPSLRPTQTGTVAAPLTPLERLRHARNRAPLPSGTSAPSAPPDQPPPAAPRPGDSRLVHLLSSRGTRRPNLSGRHLEKHWYQCLQYPLRACHFCFGLSLTLTLCSGAVAVLLPLLLSEPPTDSWALGFFYAGCGLLLVLLVGLPCSFLEMVLASAMAGEVYYLRWSGNLLLTVLLSGAKWLSCFLAGPVVFAMIGGLYWLDCGEPELLDWLILAELSLVTVAYWLFALLAVTDRGRLRALNPAAVADLAYRLGWRGMALVLAAGALLLVHGLVLAAGVEAIHLPELKGWLLLAGGWVSGLFWGTFFCRLLGVRCHRSRPAVGG